MSVPRTSVAIVTLGCARNDVDSDQLAALFERDGYTVVDGDATADVVVVNTCTFIQPATQESIDTVLAACDGKADGTKAVVVVGCMAQRYRDELAAALPEADAIVGFDAYPRLGEIVGDVLAGRRVAPFVAGSATSPPVVRRSLPLIAMPAATAQDTLDSVPASGPRIPTRRFVGGPWAYLKIASGCDRVCTFCAIPSWRGGFRSRPMDELETEARWLVDRGAKELVLVSENTTSYGKDLGGRELQPVLLERLSTIEGLERVRLMYLQPAELTRPLLETMAALPKVASYFDLSLQHASATVLDRMARSGSVERFLALVGDIRSLDPHAVFRSNFIVGFPGETEDEFAQLEGFLTEAELDWVGVFAFSPEEGTPAATLPHQVAPELADERRAKIVDLAEQIALDRAEAFVGRRLDVIVEDIGEEGSVGRSYREAPETDGEIRLVDRVGVGASVPIGRTLTAEVVDTDGVDLVATPVG